MIVFTDPSEAGKLICCPAILALDVRPLDEVPDLLRAGRPLTSDLFWYGPDYEATPRERRLARAWHWLRGGR